MLRVRAEARRNGSVCAAVPLAHGPSCVLRAPRRDRSTPRGWGGEVMDRRCGDARSRRHASAATSVATVTAIQYAPTAPGGAGCMDPANLGGLRNFGCRIYTAGPPGPTAPVEIRVKRGCPAGAGTRPPGRYVSRPRGGATQGGASGTPWLEGRAGATGCLASFRLLFRRRCKSSSGA
eukprot:scaffold604_cov384-Prasinococcus_capsulatus_cf.AAC.6